MASSLPTRSPHYAALAIVLGLLGDALLRALPWGLNIALFATIAWLGLRHLARAQDVHWNRATHLSLLIAQLFAWAHVLHDAVTMRGATLLGAGIALLLAGSYRDTLRPFGASIVDYFRSLLESASTAFVGGLPVFREVEPDDRSVMIPGLDISKAVGRGLLIALPFAGVFAFLFASADLRFSNSLRGLVDLDFEVIATHVMWLVAVTWLAAGVIRMLTGTRFANLKDATTLRKLDLGAVEIAVVYSIINVLFLWFVVLQLGYLFGGDEFVRDSSGPSYADYARRGFFELLAVVSLVVPFVLFFDWLGEGNSPGARRASRGLAAVLLISTSLIIVSALHRLKLYVDAYGLTEERYLAAAIILWLAVLLFVLLLRVLRGRRQQFTGLALATAAAAVLVVVLTNPRAQIAGHNLARAQAGAKLDIRYLQALGYDAVPAALAARESLTPAAQKAVDNWLLDCHKTLAQSREEDGLRAWNWSRQRALTKLEAHETLSRTQ